MVHFNRLSYLVFFIVGLWTHSLLAQKTLIDRTVSVSSKEKNIVSARAEMVNAAFAQATQDLVKEIIGEPKYNRNKTIINNKILKNTARFIPFSKTGEVKAIEPEGYSMSVNLKVSLSDLQSLLLENGLFYQSDSAPMILPTVRFNDRIRSKVFVWWYSKDKNEDTFLTKQGVTLENTLKAALSKNSFYLIRPQQFKYHNARFELPKSESVRPENWQSMAQSLGAQIQLLGEINYSNSRERSEAFTITVSLSAIQIQNGRVVAEITRQFETEAGGFPIAIEKKAAEVFESASADLSAQIMDAWQRGVLGAELFRMRIKGRVPLVQQESIKELIKARAREIKSVKERVISAEGLVLELDASLGPQDLANRAPEIDLGNNSKLVLESVQDRELIYRFEK
jgi:hypothetical protein